MVVVDQTDRFYAVCFAIQRVFNATLLWESRMDRFVFRNRNKAQFSKLIPLSQDYLGNFVCVTDNAYNFIAHSPVSDEREAYPYDSYTKHHCFSEEEIAFVENEVLPLVKPSARLVVSPPNERCPHTTFHYPVYIDGMRLFHVVMVCVEGSVKSLRDMFSKFMSRFAQACKDYWSTYVDLSAPWHRLFNAIIDGGEVPQAYRDAQIRASLLPDIAQIRTLVCRFDDALSYEERSRIVKASELLNGGRCLSFMHYGELVVVCYASEQDESRLSGRVVEESARELLFEPYGIVCGMSQRAYRIEDLRYAYLQATAALRYIEAYRTERAVYSLGDDIACVPFDYALKYYLLDACRDDDLVRFSFERSIFNKLVDEDAQKGTELSALVVAFIGNNLNGTKASQAFHAHRNTILYHVDRIEKRFDISLKSPFTNQRIMLDYYYHLKSSAHGS